MIQKRSLGQNFFVNKNLKNSIVRKTLENYNSTDNLLIEIGPGTGEFTQEITKSFQGDMIVIEKDSYISNKWSLFYPKIPIIEADILRISLTDISLLLKKDLAEYKNLIVFGSLPYNISKKIIEKVVMWKGISECFFIIQKEVAEKYTDKKSSILKLRTEPVSYTHLTLPTKRIV